MRLARSTAPLIASALALGGTGLLLFRRASTSATSSAATVLDAHGCPAGSPGNASPQASTSPNDAAAQARIPEVAERLRRLWTAATGDAGPPCEAVLQMLIAHSWLEGGLGTWWTDKTGTGAGDMRGSGNLGARQCTTRDGEGGAYFRCVEYGDSKPNADGTQTKIAAKFRYYTGGKMPDGSTLSAADAAAWDLLHDVTNVWPALAELKSGDVRAYVTKLHDKGYYQGFGADTEARVNGYGRAVASRLPGAAYALGDSAILATIDPAFLSGHAYVAPSKVAGTTGLLVARRDHGSGQIVWYVAA